MRQAGVIVVALMIALGAAACGGGGGSGGDRLSKDEYEQQMSAIGTDLQEASSGVDISETTDLDKVADTVAEFKSDLETAADKVDDLNPPEDADEEMEQAARDRDKPALQKAQQAVITEGNEAQQAAEDLKAKGYDIGELGTGG